MSNLIPLLLKQPIRHEMCGEQRTAYLNREEVLYLAIQHRNYVLSLLDRVRAEQAYLQLPDDVMDEVEALVESLDQAYWPAPFAPNEPPEGMDKRYIVVKLKDIPNDGEQGLRDYLKENDIPTRAGVVVESSNPLCPSVAEALRNGGHFDPRVNQVLDAISSVVAGAALDILLPRVKAIMENGDGQGSLDLEEQGPAAVPGTDHPPL